MDKEIRKFGDIEDDKQKFHLYKNCIFLDKVNIYNIKVSTMISSSKKKKKKIMNTSLVT